MLSEGDIVKYKSPSFEATGKILIIIGNFCYIDFKQWIIENPIIHNFSPFQWKNNFLLEKVLACKIKKH